MMQPETSEELFRAAAIASRNAHAPYSGFRVGAAVLAASGAVYVGVNVENIAYPLGTCAEASALAAARTAEGEGLEVRVVAVWAEHEEKGQIPCSPCGGCRQRILELGRRCTVAYFDAGLSLVERPAKELLPDAFSF
jgi:cytidine deaminase